LRKHGDIAQGSAIGPAYGGSLIHGVLIRECFWLFIAYFLYEYFLGWLTRLVLPFALP
jgi:hypothetical protein